MSVTFLVDLVLRESLLRTRVDVREIQLLIRRLEFQEQLKYHVQHLVRAGVFAVDLVDHHDGLQAVLERLAEDEFRLRLGSVVTVDHQQHAIDHLHDPLHLAAEVRVSRRVHDVHVVVLPTISRVLRPDRNALLLLQVHRIHHPFVNLLVGAERSGLLE